MPRFDRLIDNIKMNAEKIYFAPPGLTCRAYRNGFIAFFRPLPDFAGSYMSRHSHWRFELNPVNIKAVFHPDYKETKNGIDYGKVGFIYEIDEANNFKDNYIIYKCPKCWNGGGGVGIISLKKGFCLKCKSELEPYEVVIGKNKA